MYYSDHYRHFGQMNLYPQSFRPYFQWGNSSPNPYQSYHPYYGNVGVEPLMNQFSTPIAYSSPNPYPLPYGHPYPSPNGIHSFMTQFKSQDGKIDFNKMMNSAGQLVGAVNQLSSLVKGLSQAFKGV